jgi:peptide/nickel transport system permease protein
MKGQLNTSTVIALGFLALIAVLVFIIPLLPVYDPYRQNLAAGLTFPFSSSFDGTYYILGTDTLGRDMLSRLSLAGRVSLGIGTGAVVISLFVGVALGLIAGYFRGWVESFIMGVADLQLSVPRVLLLIAVTAIVGPSLVNLTLLLGLTSWVAYGRVARAMALSLREREFVLSAITQGATSTWNIRKHLLPNVLPQMLIVGSYELGQIIVLESSLSYLGLGVQPPLPSWGMMVSEGQSYLELDPWLFILPSIALFLLVAGVQFLSQAFTAENDTSAEIVKAES